MTVDKSVILFYTGNVCSSPLIASFNRIKGFAVPIAENLDEYLIRKHTDVENIDQVFNEALVDIVEHRQSALLSQLKIELEAIRTQYLAFKWRPFLRDQAAIKERQRILREMNATPFLIARRSVSHQAIKIKLSEKLHQTRHLQGRAAKLSESDYQRLISTIEQTRVSLHDSEVSDVVRIAKNFLDRTRNTFNLAKKHFPETYISMMISEDFFTPMLEEELFLDYFSDKLHLNLPSFDNLPIAQGKRKAGYSVGNCSNLDEVVSNPVLIDIETEYSSLLESAAN